MMENKMERVYSWLVLGSEDRANGRMEQESVGSYSITIVMLLIKWRLGWKELSRSICPSPNNRLNSHHFNMRDVELWITK